jgi:hypothetical protein
MISIMPIELISQYPVMQLNVVTNRLAKQGITLASVRQSHGDEYICEATRIATEDGEVVSLTHRPRFTPRKIFGIQLSWRLSKPQGHTAAGRIREIEKEISDIENPTREIRR